MESVADTWTIKIGKKDLSAYLRRPPKSPPPIPAQNCCPKPKKKACPLKKICGSKSPSLNTLQQSLSANCCQCCYALGQYMNEAGRLIGSCLGNHPVETRVSELFSRLLEAGLCVTGDLYELLKRLLKFLCVVEK